MALFHSLIWLSNIPSMTFLVAQWQRIHLHCRRCKRHGFNPWFGKIPWSRKGQPTLVFLPVRFHRQRTLAGYSPLNCRVRHAWEYTHTPTQITSYLSIHFLFFIFFVFRSFIFFSFYFILLYNTVLVLPYINMYPPRVYTCSQSWTPLPPPSSYHLSGSSQGTSPKHPVSCIKPRLAIHFLYDSDAS